MNIVNNNDGLLTNVEVLSLLKNRIEKPRRITKPSQLIFDEASPLTIKYLSGSPINKVSGESQVKSLCNKLIDLDLGLSEMELVQIGNLLPQYSVEIYMIIDNCAEKLSEDQIQFIINAVKDSVEIK